MPTIAYWSDSEDSESETDEAWTTVIKRVCDETEHIATCQLQEEDVPIDLEWFLDQPTEEDFAVDLEWFLDEPSQEDLFQFDTTTPSPTRQRDYLASSLRLERIRASCDLETLRAQPIAIYCNSDSDSDDVEAQAILLRQRREEYVEYGGSPRLARTYATLAFLGECIKRKIDIEEGVRAARTRSRSPRLTH